jgi:hypothetical protein
MKITRKLVLPIFSLLIIMQVTLQAVSGEKSTSETLDHQFISKLEK